VLGYEDGRAEVWSLRLSARIGGTGSVATAEEWSVPFGFAVAATPDGSALLVATDRPRVWDTERMGLRCEGSPRQVFEASVARGGRVAVVNDTLSYARIDLTSCKTEEEGWTRTGGTFPTRVSPDGAWVAASDRDGHELAVYATQPFRRVATLASVTSCDEHIIPSFSPDGRVLWARGGNRWFASFRVGDFKSIARYRPPGGKPVEGAVELPNGKQLALRRAGRYALVDLPSGREVCRLDSTVPIQASPDASHFAGVRRDAVAIWEVASCSIVRELD
jgi:hypothetical protein